MIGYSAEELCMALLRADTEEEVIRLLELEGYWDNPDVWRPFGDREDNFATVGNQSSSADGALVEKLVNSVDAVLMGKCWSTGVRPNSSEAPRSIPQAVAEFFFGDRSKAETMGRVSNWDTQKRREMSNLVTLAATGSRSSPSLTIVDAGEGQTPERMPETLLSIDKQNKIDVHFVQGKFNMGGTGALRFCGQNNLQLVISRRDSNITNVDSGDDSSGQWGFTVVRRENPTATKRVSTYTYLAPLNADRLPKRGGVLRFSVNSLPLFPVRNQAYVRDTQWGTAIKLYEYNAAGRFRSHILLSDGWLYRLDLLLPQVALPIRLHECRDYSGRRGSFDTTLTGLSVRLSDDRGDNVEDGFPTSSTLTISGEQMTAEVYAFKRGKADTYRKSEGIVFVVNGQTHGNLTRRFFRRTAVKMSRLEDSILVVVDCSHISGRAREDLFMNSRDRMEQGKFLKAIEGELESIIEENSLLRELRERRRREDVAAKLENSEPMKQALASIIRKSPSLASLFGGLGPLPNPFNPKPKEKPFEGRPHPSLFKFKQLDYGKKLNRETPLNMRSRIIFETDVVNDYFKREKLPGTFSLRSLDTNGSLPDHRLNLEAGTATLNLSLPKGVSVGDVIRYEVTVSDDALVEEFWNRFDIRVKPKQVTKPHPPHPPHPPKDPEGLAVPDPILVWQSDWDKHGFDKNSALKVFNEGDETEGGSYTYYINMDNIYLQTELKAASESPEVVKAKWQYSLMIVGMALIHGQASDEDIDDEDGLSVEEQVFRTTTILAPVLLPIIESLGGLSQEDLNGAG